MIISETIVGLRGISSMPINMNDTDDMDFDADFEGDFEDDFEDDFEGDFDYPEPEEEYPHSYWEDDFYEV